MPLLSGYREFPVPARYADALDCWWTNDGKSQRPTRVMPDACVDLVWRQGRGIFIAGPDTEPWLADPTAPGRISVAVRFRPGSGGAALGLPLRELRNQRVDFADLAKSLPIDAAWIDPLRDLDNGDLDTERALRLIPAFAAKLVEAAPPDATVRQLARRLSVPGTKVSTVAGDLGLSERHLYRRCEAGVGYGPKTLDRVLRFRRFVDLLAAGDGRRPELASLAFEAGYADQAHLSRECRRLSGLSPSTLALDY